MTSVAPSRSLYSSSPSLSTSMLDRCEWVECYLCGSRACTPFLAAEDDLTGKPGRFTFVTCDGCGLRSQKDALVSRYVTLGPQSRVLDAGCAVGTFLQRMRVRYGASVTGVDFKDLSANPSLANVDFRCGLFYEQNFGEGRFDLITMWHFLEHDYDPMRTLRTARDLLAPEGRLVVEVPQLDSLTFRLYGDRWPGLQAPPHTVLYDRDTLLAAVEAAGLEVVEHLPYGAFPAFFYFFAGAAFKLLKGRGLNLRRAIFPYFVGQILVAPILAFEKQLNFAMQTVVCRRKS